MSASSLPALSDERLAAGAARRANRHRSHFSSRPPTSSSPWDAATSARSRPAVSTWTGPVADPDGAPIADVRKVRDDIDAHITGLLDSLPR